MKLLLIEDDELLSTGLLKAFQFHNFVADSARTFAMAKHLDLSGYDLVILDLGLPDGDGAFLLKMWRSAGVRVPILILTARDAIEERVNGLDLGADDYLVKPFALDELMARIRALLRRKFDQTENLIEIGSFVIDMEQHQIQFEQQWLNLTKMEFSILRRLILLSGKIVPRERLQQDLYDWNNEVGSNTLEVYIHHLRKKIGANAIKTIRGEGYRLEI